MSPKVVYLDCPSGASGDMLIAALSDCGLDLGQLQQHLERLALPGWQLSSKRVQKNGLDAHKIDFLCPEEHHHRHLSDILVMIGEANLPAAAAALARKAFCLLAEAEAAAHGCAVEQVHFHEVGAADAILDICSVALALDMLGVEQVYCSDLPLSSGFVDCAHGRMPVPAPATLNLLQGFTLYDSGLTGELITPTGAALLKAMAAKQEKPQLKLISLGLGAGTRDLPQANVLRALYGELQDTVPEEQTVDVITCNLDDCHGEILGYVLPRLLEAGALDACYLPLYMKKGRPAWQLQVICPPTLTESLAQLIFQETSSLGMRVSRERRITAPREIKTIQTDFGPIRVKISGCHVAPEYEDIAAAAREAQLPYKEVLRQVLAICYELEG